MATGGIGCTLRHEIKTHEPGGGETFVLKRVALFRVCRTFSHLSVVGKSEVLPATAKAHNPAVLHDKLLQLTYVFHENAV